MKLAHQLWKDQQSQAKEEIWNEPLQFAVKSLLLLQNRQRQKIDSSKLQWPFIDPFAVIVSYPQLKSFIPSVGSAGQAPTA